MNLNLNYDNLSEEKQNTILNHAKLSHYRLFVNKRSFFGKMLQKFKYRKLFKAKTLKEYVEIRQMMHETGVCYGDIYEWIARPLIGVEREDLYALGLDKKEVDEYWELHRHSLF